MHLTILTADTAPSASRPLLEGIATQLGFVPNLAGVAAASPTLLAAFDAVRRIVVDPDVPAIHREIAGVAVGVAVDNAYGVAFHSTVLASLGVDEPAIEAMRAGEEPAEPIHAAVYAFAREVAAERARSPTAQSPGPTTSGSRMPTCSSWSPSAPSWPSSAPSTTSPGACRSTSSCSRGPGRRADATDPQLAAGARRPRPGLSDEWTQNGRTVIVAHLRRS